MLWRRESRWTQEIERAVCPGIWVSIFCGQLLIRESNFYYWRQGFFKSRFWGLFVSLIWSQVSCHDTHHLGPIWLDPGSYGFVLECCQDRPLTPNSWSGLPLCRPPAILLEPNWLPLAIPFTLKSWHYISRTLEKSGGESWMKRMVGSE